jgi:hypothetical protein
MPKEGVKRCFKKKSLEMMRKRKMILKMSQRSSLEKLYFTFSFILCMVI